MPEAATAADFWLEVLAIENLGPDKLACRVRGGNLQTTVMLRPHGQSMSTTVVKPRPSQLVVLGLVAGAALLSESSPRTTLFFPVWVRQLVGTD